MTEQYVVRVWTDSGDPDIVGPFESVYEAQDFANRIELKVARDYGEEYGESSKMGAEVHEVLPTSCWSEEWFAYPFLDGRV